MNFHEIRFPTNVSLGAVGGPERRTEIVTLANGFEERNALWKHSRRRFDAGLGVQYASDLEAVLAFFEARYGQLYGFRWKDWSDYRSSARAGGIAATDQVIGTGDGISTDFSLTKQYRSGEQSYTRPIQKPVEGTVAIAVDGQIMRESVDWTLDSTSGQIAFVRAPGQGAEITAGYEFDVPVRFDTDRLEISMSGFDAGEVPAIPVVEVRL